MSLSIFKYGALNKCQMGDLNKLNPQTVLVYSTINSLCQSSFVREHDGLSLNAFQIREKANLPMADKMVRRQILILKNEGKILSFKRGNLNIIKMPESKQARQFTIFFGLQGEKELETPSMSVLLSVLMDKAIFNYRSSDENCNAPFLEKYQLTKLQEQTGLSERTITDNLKKLVKHNLIFVKKSLTEVEYKRFLQKPQEFPLEISDELFNLYQQIVKVRKSAKARDVLRQNRNITVKAYKDSQKGFAKKKKGIAATEFVQAKSFIPKAHVPIIRVQQSRFSTGGDDFLKPINWEEMQREAQENNGHTMRKNWARWPNSQEKSGRVYM